jgi:hypothetical protein
MISLDFEWIFTHKMISLDFEWISTHKIISLDFEWIHWLTEQKQKLLMNYTHPHFVIVYDYLFKKKKERKILHLRMRGIYL